jgi:hypothetical protein
LSGHKSKASERAASSMDGGGGRMAASMRLCVWYSGL